MKFGYQNVVGQLDNTITTDGALLPRLTNTQEGAIASPTTGILIYNTDLNAFRYYNGSTWVTISTGSGGTPGGSDTQVQFNDSGTFGGDSGLVYDKSTDNLKAVLITGLDPANATSSGKPLAIAGGDGGATSGYGGNVTIDGGDSTSGNGGNVIITSGVSADGEAGDISLVGADSVINYGGGRINITGGKSPDFNSSDGGRVSITGGPTDTYIAGQVTITGGDGGSTGTGGQVSVYGGAGGFVSGNAGSILLNGGNSSSGDGGGVTLFAGYTTGGKAGTVSITGGIANSTATASGTVTIIGGNSSSSSLAAGKLSLTGGGNTSSGNGGPVIITGGASDNSPGVGGDVTITGGNPGGNITATSGTGSSTGIGGTLTLSAGKGGASSGNGGALTISGGGATTGTGGAVTISGGAGGTTSGNGGALTLQSGLPNDGNGGAVSISGRNGVGTNRSGGTVTLTAGNSTGTGTAGSVTIAAGAGGSGTGGSISIASGTGTTPGNVTISTNGSTALTLSSTGALRLNTYTAGYLQTDGSGNVTAGSVSASPTFTGTAGENIANGAIVAIINSSGPKIVQADASNGVGNRNKPIGVATAAATSGATVTVQYGAKISIPDAQWDSVPAVSSVGSFCYLSDQGSTTTAGIWTLTAPSSSGFTVVKCGILSNGGSGAVEVIVQIGDITIIA